MLRIDGETNIFASILVFFHFHPNRLLLSLAVFSFSSLLVAQGFDTLIIPQLHTHPIIDGHLDEWKKEALNNGQWNLERVKKQEWFSPKRNRLTTHPGEDTNTVDLSASYYSAWRKDHLYLGAEVIDNHIDVSESNHEPKRWYYKDAIAWFFELPIDTLPEKFEQGNHGFAFVADTAYPSYGAWWRHGSHESSYIEQPIPKNTVDYVILPSDSGYSIEASIQLTELINQPINEIALGSMMIVHCDPDGGEYGGHLLIYGKGDLDQTWTPVIFAP